MAMPVHYPMLHSSLPASKAPEGGDTSCSCDFKLYWQKQPDRHISERAAKRLGKLLVLVGDIPKGLVQKLLVFSDRFLIRSRHDSLHFN
jgi:hypothetical protein